MKPTHEPASCHPKPCASLKRRRRNLARLPHLVGSRRKEIERAQRAAFSSEKNLFAPLILMHNGSTLSRLIDDRAALTLRTVPTAHAAARAIVLLLHNGAFRNNSAPRLSRATINTSRTAQKSSEEAHLMNTIPNQPNRHRISTDGLNREDSQLAASLEGESGECSPTSAGKTFPHP